MRTLLLIGLLALAATAAVPAATATTVECEASYTGYLEAGCSARDIYNGIGVGDCVTVGTDLQQHDCTPPGF